MVGGACGLLPGLGWVGRAVRGRGCSEGDMRIGRDWERVGGEGRGGERVVNILLLVIITAHS